MDQIKWCCGNSFGDLCPLRNKCACFENEKTVGRHPIARFTGETCVNFVEVEKEPNASDG